MSPALLLTALAAAVAPAAASAQASTSPAVESPASSTNEASSSRADKACRSQDRRDIVVCGQRRQGYRIDPDVTEASREAETNNRSASAPSPVAQSACSSQPMGCGKSLDSLDLANVAIVAAGIAINAAKGETWTNAFRTGGPGEYQLYQEARRRREAANDERAAAQVRMKAREAQAEAASASPK